MNQIKSQYWWILPLVIFLAISIACGSSSNAGTKVGSIDATDSPVKTEAPTEPTIKGSDDQSTAAPEPTKIQPTKMPIYQVGDVIELPDQLIAMYGAEFKGDLLITKFIIGNPGADEITVSSLLGFSAKNPDGTKLEVEFFDCGSGLDGAIPAGDKLKGQMCWKGAQPGTKVYFEANPFETGAIVWQIAETVPDKEIEFPSMANLEIKQEIFNVGDLIDANGHYIVLTGAEYKGDQLIADFLVGNSGSEELTISSMVSFSARNPAGETLPQEYMECEPRLDGTLAPGDMIKGRMCWNGAEPGSKIYYDATLFDSGIFIWELAESVPPVAKEYPEISALQISQPTFKPGDVVELADHQITLNSATITGDFLKTNFTIENKGSEDVNVSSLVSFSARNPDGTPLSQDYLNCGTSLDGKVIPGDLLKGDICWKGAKPGARIYYDDSLFETGMTIWVIE